MFHILQQRVRIHQLFFSVVGVLIQGRVKQGQTRSNHFLLVTLHKKDTLSKTVSARLRIIRNIKRLYPASRDQCMLQFLNVLKLAKHVHNMSRLDVLNTMVFAGK